MSTYPLRVTSHAESHVVEPIEGLRRSNVDDAETIADKLTEAHLLEMAALHLNPRSVLQRAIAGCACFTVTDVEKNDAPIGLVGVAGYVDDPQVGVVFGFLTDRLLQKRKMFYAASREWTEGLNGRFPVLMTSVWSRNFPASLWLRTIGFKKLKTSRCGSDFFIAYVKTRLG